MTKKRDIEGLLIAGLLGEATAEERAELASALADDPARREEYDGLKKTMQTLSGVSLAPDPGRAYWDSVWPEFENRLLAAEMKERQPRLSSPWWTQFWRPALQISLVGIMLVLGIFIGRELSRSEPLPGPYAGQTPTPLSIPYEQEINREKQDYLLNVTERSLARSGQVLDRFMQLRPEEVSGDSGLITSQRDEIITLLDEISQLRAAGVNPRMQEFSPLFDELEILMGEIASIRGEPVDIQFEVRMLQQGIVDRNIVDRLKRAHGFTLVGAGGQDR